MWAIPKLPHRVVIAALFATATACPAAERWAGLADSVFQHLAHDNELPNSAVPTSLAEDGAGFLWVGSQNGLSRWDGYHFRVWRSDPGRPGALPDNFIQTLHTDASGRLWIGTSSGGLARYERAYDGFVAYPAGDRGLSHVSVRAIADDGAGGIWVGTEGGLDHIAADSSTIVHLRHREGDSGGVPDNRIWALLHDRHGTLWIGTANGLVGLRDGTSALVPVPLPEFEGKGPSILTLFEDRADRIWIGTAHHGAYVIESRGAAARPVEESGPAQSTLATEGVRTILEVIPGKVWLGTLGHGIVTVDVATLHTQRIRHDPALPDSLADNTVLALYKDRGGLIWVCSNRSLSRYDPAQSAIVTVFGASSRTDGLSDTNVDSVLPMPDGRIWLGLDSHGVDVFDPAGARVAELRPDVTRPETALPKDYVNALATAPTGDVYIGTEEGLYRADRAAHGVVRVPVAQRDPAAPVWALLVDQNVLWLGGFDGLWALELSGVHSSAVGHSEPVSGLTDQRVTAIERGGPGFLWVGTKNGLNRLDLATHLIERILPDSKDPSSLGSGYVTSLLTDASGRLWVATFGSGVSVLDSRDSRGRPRFHRIGIADGLANDNTNKLLEDPQHRVWVSTDDGLASIDERTFAVRTFRRAEGLPISNYWAGAGAATPQGELLFGGVGGLTIVRPEKLTQWSYQPPIVITDIRVGGKAVAAGRASLGDATAEPITVTPHANSLAVEFSALDYSAPERNRYAYKLEGYDSTWIDSEPAHRLAAYTNLPPGQYILRLRGSNRGGLWSQSALGVPIRVLPAWYQTITFRIAATLAALAFIAGLVQGRTVYLRRHQRDLERQVIERTAELRESQRQLEQIAYFDTLTALPNRRMFTEEFRELIVLARLQGERFALLVIDLDRFKQINDSHGHDVGDALLIETAIRLQAAVRKSDCVARLGGDEFAVLVAHNPSASDIEGICHRIIESFVMPLTLSATSVKSSASIGVAVFPDHGATLDALYKSADLALYEAKRAGGNLYRWYRAPAPTPIRPAAHLDSKSS